MNVIVFSKRAGSARQFELGRPLAMTVTIGIVVTVLAGVLLLGIQLGRSGLVDPAAQVTEWGAKLEQQRVEVANVRRDLQERLDALTSRVGQMNAHVIRLDALGRRLTEMANLDKGEFNFDSEPAVGGPEGLVEGASVAAPDLTAMLDELANQIRDRERQLSVLESMISTRNLSRQVVPDGASTSPARPARRSWRWPPAWSPIPRTGSVTAGRSRSITATVTSPAMRTTRRRWCRSARPCRRASPSR